MKKFKNISEIDTFSWDEFVENHPNGNFFQTRQYFQLHTNLWNCKPIGYAVCEDNVILGIIVGIIFKNYIWPLNIFTKRTVIIGGPLIIENRKDVFDFLIENFYNIENKNSIYIQFRNLWDIKKDNFDFLKYGFLYEDHLDIIHDLTEEKEIILSKISKGKKGNINKSKNKGTTFKEITDFQNFKTGVELIILTYKKIGLPCPTKEFFYNAFEKYNQSGLIKSFGVYVNNEIIAIRIEVCFKSCIYDWYTGSNEKFNNRYPNDVLPYNILLWGKDNGFKCFDFGGAGKPNIKYGVRDHKLKFGGKLVSYGRYERINNKYKMFFLKLGFFLFKIKKDKKN